MFPYGAKYLFVQCKENFRESPNCNFCQSFVSYSFVFLCVLGFARTVVRNKSGVWINTSETNVDGAVHQKYGNVNRWVVFNFRATFNICEGSYSGQVSW